MARTLRKSKNRLLLGVAGGVAEYLRIDPVIVRVVFILLALAQGLGVLLYLLLALFMPRAAAPSTDALAALKDNLVTAPGEASEAGRRVLQVLRGQPEPAAPAPGVDAGPSAAEPPEQP